MNLKKSLLSLATIMALGNSAFADNGATYVPLASDTADSSWVLFGVNGFSDGTPSAIGTATSSFQAGFTELEDTTISDTLATSGLAAAAGGGDMATLQAIDDGTTTTLKVGMDMTGTVFDLTESVRTMYVKVNSSVPNLKLDYKASLEGKGMEILRNGTLYSVTLSQDSTWSGAVSATSGGLAAAASSSDRKLLTEVLDADFSNNPTNPVHFDSSVHFDATSGLNRANMYHFNAITQQWEVWNVNNPANANDFTSLSIGKAYWGRTDTTDIVINADGSSGLVLGAATALSGLPDPDRYQDENNVSTLTTGWNMLSFDDSKPYIRHAATGLLTSGWAAADTVTLIDDSGLNSIDVVLAGADDEQGWAQAINVAIESAKLRGVLPETFNIKAFATEAAATNAGGLAFISDRKFSIDATAVAVIPATTLTGSDPYVTATGVTGVVADIEATPATSAYGEYGMIIDLMTQDLTGAPTAATLDSLALAGAGAGGTNVSAKILLGDASGDNTAVALTGVADADPTVVTAKGTIEADPIMDGTDGTGLVTAIDIDGDGALDKVIVASTIPFYVKDNTFVRVFTVSATGTGAITMSNTVSATLANTDGTPTAAEIVTLSEAESDNAGADGNTNIYLAAGTGAQDLIAVSTGADTFDLKDAASSTVDILAQGSDTHDIAAGAIKGAYSLDGIAELPLIQHEFVTNFTTEAQPTNAAATLDIQINGNALIDELVVGAAAIVDSPAGRKAYFDLIVNAINGAIPANTHYYATHDFDTTTDDFAATKIAVTGTEITIFTIVAGLVADGGADIIPSVPADTYAATAETLGSGVATGDLSEDVKTNPIYTPNYAIHGPLYTLRDSGTGYDARAFLKATTELDAATGNIAWDSIDITRNENEWFANNEFNLFKINHKAGYWVYLEDKAAATVSIGTPTFANPGYTYYFKAASPYTTTNIINSGQMQVTITGLDDAVAGSAYAIIGGENVQLKRSSASSDVFTADITNYALQSFSSGTPVNVDIRAVNGKGEAVSVSTALTIDYVKPTSMTATASGGKAIALSATDAANYYIYSDYIPEVQTARTSALVDTAADVNGSATYDVCSKFNFGTTNTLRIVAADGVMNSSNVSDAVQYIYASALKGAHVLTHTQGGGTLKSQIGTRYTSTCDLNATQPSAASDNNGVSLKTLTNATTSRMSFVPDANSNFDQDLGWTTHYDLPTAVGTAVIEVQSTSAYAGDTFYVEYGGALYTGTFVSTEAAADASIGTPENLTLVTGAQNTSLVP